MGTFGMIRLSAAVSVFLLFQAQYAECQNSFWEPIHGPFRGVVNCIVVTPHETILVGANVPGADYLFRSTDNGYSWNYVLMAHVDDLALDRKSGILYAGVAGTPNVGCVYQSTDDGASWQVANSALGEGFSLAIDSDEDIFVGTFANGLYRSTDKGVSWELLNTNFTQDRMISLAVTRNGSLLAGTYSGGVYFSSDRGDTWSSRGLDSVKGIYPLIASPTGKVYACSDSGLFCSTDQGENWARLSLPDTVAIHSFAVDSSGQLLAGGRGRTYASLDPRIALNPRLGVYASTDRGVHWSRRGLTKYSVMSIFAEPNGRVLAGTDGGLQLSEDNCMTWHLIGISGMPIFALTSASDGNIFAGDDMQGIVFRSTNNGVDWERMVFGLTLGHIEALAVNSLDHLYAAALGYPSAVYRSTDEGDHWDAWFPAEINGFSFDSRGYGFAAASVGLASAGGIYRSTDNGALWSQIVVSDFDVRAVASNPPFVYAGSANGIYRSQDSGDNWVQSDSGLSSLDVTSVVVDTTITHSSYGWVFGGTSDSGVFRSTDNGESWHHFNKGMRGLKIIRLAINGKGDLAAISDSGAYYMKSDNTTWACLPWDFPLPALTMMITAGGQIYVAPHGGALQRNKAPLVSVDAGHSIVSSNLLFQNYPNPFNPSTIISYDVPTSSHVSLVIYDILGRELETLVSGYKSPGHHSVTFDGSKLSSGVYFYRIQAGNYTATKKLMLVK